MLSWNAKYYTTVLCNLFILFVVVAFCQTLFFISFRRKAIALSENNGIYVQNTHTGEVSCIVEYTGSMSESAKTHSIQTENYLLTKRMVSFLGTCDPWPAVVSIE